MSRFAVEKIGDATPTVAIYALCEYPSWEPRYVGKTIQYIGERHKAHIRKATGGSHLPVYRWLRKQIESETARLAIKLLEYVGPGVDWRDRERHWIETYRPSGRLLNLTNGGEGLHGHRFSEQHRARIAAALRTGAHFNCQKCGAQFWRKRRDILTGHAKFCSRTCSNSRNRTKGFFDA